MDYPVKFPVAVRDGAGQLTVWYGAAGFAYGSGDRLVNYPASAWATWTANDWASFCPDWRVVDLIDTPPIPVAGKRAVRRSEAEWTEGADAITVTYRLVDLSPAELAVQAAASGVALKQAVAEAVQRHIDATVAPRSYASATAAVSYIGDPNPVWDAEGRAVLRWRSDVWTTCFAALDDVVAGRRAPLTPAEMVAELPPLVWPD